MSEARERSALDPRDRLAVMVSMAGSYIESGRGDDALAVMRTVAEDVATEIARLTRELEEARERVRGVRSAVIRATAALVRLDLRWDPREEAEWVRRESVVKIATRLGDKVLALSTPQEAGGADCRCAPAAPWRSDGATCPDWPGCGSSDWRPATPQEAPHAD